MSLAAQRIYDTLKNAQQNNDLSTDILSGTVTSVNPLIIGIENRLPIDEDYITLSVLCKEFKVKGVTAVSDTIDPHFHEIELLLWRGLIVGDVVNMIKMSGNQKYYVIERRGMENDFT